MNLFENEDLINDYYLSRCQEILEKIKTKLGNKYNIKTNFDSNPLFPEVTIDEFYIGSNSFHTLSNNLYLFLLGIYCSEKIVQDKIKSALE